MFLSNKVKSIAAVSLLSLGALGSQALLASKAHAQSLVPMACSQGKCNIRVNFDNSAAADVLIVPNTSGIMIPRSVVKELALKGWTRGDLSQTSTFNFNSITIGNKTYSMKNTPARIVSSGNQIMIGANTLEALGARRHGNSNQLLLP